MVIINNAGIGLLLHPACPLQFSVVAIHPIIAVIPGRFMELISLSREHMLPSMGCSLHRSAAAASAAYPVLFLLVTEGTPMFQALAGSCLTIQGDGQQSRDFVHVSDVVEALRKAMEHVQCIKLRRLAPQTSGCPRESTCGESINVGTGRAHSVSEVAQIVSDEVASCTGRAKADVRYHPARPFDIASTLASVSKAEALLGWSATVPFEMGMRQWARNELQMDKLSTFKPDK
eukprot:scaffold84790_cov49-Prasinocladus_malaysianus.AAC.1